MGIKWNNLSDAQRAMINGADLAPQPPEKVSARERREIARRETDEQKLFYAWLRKQRLAGKLLFLWSRSDKATTIQVGHPDFSIWLSYGRTLLIEFKAPAGKLSVEQQAARELFGWLSHRYVVVTTAAEARDKVEILLGAL